MTHQHGAIVGYIMSTCIPSKMVKKEFISFDAYTHFLHYALRRKLQSKLKFKTRDLVNFFYLKF